MVAEHVTDVYLAPIEMDGSDEPVFVSTDIECDKLPDFVCGWEGDTQSLKIREVVPLHDFGPPDKSTFAVGVLLPKLA